MFQKADKGKRFVGLETGRLANRKVGKLISVQINRSEEIDKFGNGRNFGVAVWQKNVFFKFRRQVRSRIRPDLTVEIYGQYFFDQTGILSSAKFNNFFKPICLHTY